MSVVDREGTVQFSCRNTVIDPKTDATPRGSVAVGMTFNRNPVIDQHLLNECTHFRGQMHSVHCLYRFLRTVEKCQMLPGVPGIGDI